MKILLDEKKNFYRANLHCHSTMSDGRYDVSTLKEEYKKRGYSIVAFTDHEHLIDNSHLNDEDFLAITSCEVAIKQYPTQSTMKNFDMKVCHLNFYSLDPHNTLTPCYSSIADHFINDNCRHLVRHDGEYTRIYSAEGISDMIRTARSQGFIVSYNHPSWSLEDARDYLGYDGLFAVEIYNHSCVMSGHNDDEAVFDHMLRAGKRIFCTACDDCHDRHDFTSPYNDSFGGWVCINAPALTYDSIMSALQDGNFYASTGPAIHSLVRDGNQVTIRTSPCRSIQYITAGRRKKPIIAPQGESLTEAVFDIRDTDGYFRLRVEDDCGKRAYTQAYAVGEDG